MGWNSSRRKLSAMRGYRHTWESSRRGLTVDGYNYHLVKIHMPMVSVEACANQTLGSHLPLSFGCISQKSAKHDQIPLAP